MNGKARSVQWWRERLRDRILEGIIRGWESLAAELGVRCSVREEPDGTGLRIYFNNVYQGRIDSAWVTRLAEEGVQEMGLTDEQETSDV